MKPGFAEALRAAAAGQPPIPGQAAPQATGMLPIHEQLLASLQERAHAEPVRTGSAAARRPDADRSYLGGNHSRALGHAGRAASRGVAKGTIEEVLGHEVGIQNLDQQRPVDGTRRNPALDPTAPPLQSLIPDEMVPEPPRSDPRGGDDSQFEEPVARWPYGHPGLVPCEWCKGTGFVSYGRKTGHCPRCKGKGRVAAVDLAKPFAEVVIDPVEAALAREIEVPLPLDVQVQPERTYDLETAATILDNARNDGLEYVPPPAVSLSYDLPQDLLELPAFAYVAGPAGTGKTFQAKAWAAHNPEGVILAATTGIAAVNLGEGTTINALLRFYDTGSLRDAFTGGWLEAQFKKLRQAGLLRVVLDEVSMLDGDQLTILCRAIDNVNQDKQEGDPELGLVLVGDFAQLPPVKAPFAFESAEWERFAKATYKLTTIRRQADRDFVEALQAVRRGDPDQALAFFGPRLEQTTHQQFDGTTILAKNEAVGKYNQLRLDKVSGATVSWPSTRWGKLRSEWGGPPKPEQDWGVPSVLKLKIGALVMVLANRNIAEKDCAPEYLYVNGDLGTVVDADATSTTVVLQRTGQPVQVQMICRENLIPLEVGRRKALRAEGHPERISQDGKHEVIGALTYLPVRLAWASTVHKCVAAGTRIPVHGHGYLPIEKVRAGHHTPYGEIRAIAKTDQQAWRITTNRGYSVVCSKDHRWYTQTGLQDATTLTAGSLIALQHGVPFGGADLIPVKLAWLLGALIGDGCCTNQDEGQIHFACINQQLGDHFKATAEALFDVRVTWRKDKRGLFWTSRNVRARLLQYGLGYAKSPLKRIPWSIWREGPVVRAAFLQGLFDTDGHVGQNRIILTTASEELGRDVQEMLLTLGIVSKRSSFTSGYKGRGDKYYQLYIGAECFDRFVNTVNFAHAEKRKKLEQSRPNRALNPALGYDEVVAVDPLGTTVPMYDVEVPNPHVMAFGPFLGHNSQGLSLDQVQINIRDHFFATPGMLYVALSRARTAAGLRVVGSVEAFRARCTVDRRIQPWL